MGVARRLNHPIDLGWGHPAWELPPNTLCYCGTEKSYSDKGGATVEKYFHYLYLRMKRASDYWGNQWDDIIREAAENLSLTDVKNFDFPGEDIGAGKPYVILAVGMEVRLFKWEPGLRELNPGKVLNLCEKSDREEIEAFLEKAQQHRKLLKARIDEELGKTN